MTQPISQDRDNFHILVEEFPCRKKLGNLMPRPKELRLSATYSSTIDTPVSIPRRRMRRSKPLAVLFHFVSRPLPATNLQHHVHSVYLGPHKSEKRVEQSFGMFCQKLG